MAILKEKVGRKVVVPYERNSCALKWAFVCVCFCKNCLFLSSFGSHCFFSLWESCPSHPSNVFSAKAQATMIQGNNMPRRDSQREKKK